MLLFSSIHLAAIGAVFALAVIGAVVYALSRTGWMRNGYFTLPAVLLVVIGLFILFQGVGSGVTVALIGTHLDLHPILTLSINGMAELTMLLLGAILVSRAVNQRFASVFRLEGIRETPFLAYLLAVPIMLVAQVGGVALSALWERLWKLFPTIYPVLNGYESASDESMQHLVTANGAVELFLILLFVAIVPAISEETLFRGFAQTNIERSGRWHTRPYLALVVASFFFALVHGSLFKLPGLFALGLTLGWMSYRTNNLLVGMLAHALNNGMIVVALFANPTNTRSNTGMVGTGDLSGTAALAGVLVTGLGMWLLLLLFNRATQHLKARHNAEQELQLRLNPPELFPASEHHPIDPIEKSE